MDPWWTRLRTDPAGFDGGVQRSTTDDTGPTPTRLDARASFRRGVVDTAPIAVGIIPFGLVAGAAAVDAGLGVDGAMALSLLVFAGASQLAAIDLLGREAPAVVVLLTVAVINLRMAMYSAALAPILGRYRRPARLSAAYVLVDQAFALTVARDGEWGERWHALAYYVGVALPLWLLWQVDTLVGALVGAALPEWLPLSATLPLVFLALLVPAVSDRATLVAAVVSGTLATVFADLAFNLGLLVGAFSGIVAGSLVALRGGLDLDVDADDEESRP